MNLNTLSEVAEYCKPEISTKKSFQNAQIINSNTVTLVNLSAKPCNSTEMQVTVKNMVSAEFKGKMKVSGKEIELIVPPSKEAEYILPLAARLNDHEITEENITAQVTAGKSSFSPELNFSGFISNKTQMKITIDGNIDDWKEVPEIKFTNMKKSNPSELVKPDDFSGWFKTCWNSNGFYLCVKITDDKFVHEEFKQVDDRWKNDSLQIYFDTLCDARMKETGKYDDNDYDYAVFPSHDGAKSIVYRYKSPDPQITLATQAPPDNRIAPEISSAFKLTSDGYVYEVFFPAKYILPIQLKEGACFGLGIFVNDKDENGGKVYHSLTTTPNGTGCWNNPHLWPSVLLRE